MKVCESQNDIITSSTDSLILINFIIIYCRFIYSASLSYNKESFFFNGWEGDGEQSPFYRDIIDRAESNCGYGKDVELNYLTFSVN